MQTGLRLLPDGLVPPPSSPSSFFLTVVSSIPGGGFLEDEWACGRCGLDVQAALGGFFLGRRARGRVREYMNLQGPQTPSPPPLLRSIHSHLFLRPRLFRSCRLIYTPPPPPPSFLFTSLIHVCELPLTKRKSDTWRYPTQPPLLDLNSD